MIKRIIYLVTEPFTKTFFDKFGIDIFEKNGFKVEVWNLQPIVYESFGQDYKAPDSIDFPGLTTFRKKKEALDSIKALGEDTFIILLIGYFHQSYPVYSALSKSRADYAIFMANTLPFPVENKKGYLQYYLKKAKKLKIKKIFSKTLFLNFTFRRFFYLWPKIKPPKLILAGGEKCFTEFYPMVSSESEVLRVHSLDYDSYLKERGIPFKAQKTAVFIDDGYAFHPDYDYVGIKPPVTPEKYFKSLNCFFDRVEKELGLKVVIAAHPRIDYAKHPEAFKGWECIRGDTCRLVKGSELVLGHCSTALNFAYIFNKPVVFKTTEEIEKVFEGTRIHSLSRYFGKESVNIDDVNLKIDWENEKQVRTECYERYRQAYIKVKGSDELPFWQTAAQRIKCMK